MAGTYERILLATDGSTLSKKAERSAIDLAAATGADLVAVHVVPRYPESYFEGALTMSPIEIARREKASAEKAQDILARVVGQAEARGVKARSAVAKSDNVSTSILAAARKYRCDLIVMASHGRKGLQRILLGSETQQVLTHGTTPVLVLR